MLHKSGWSQQQCEGINMRPASDMEVGINMTAVVINNEAAKLLVS